jgi:hypothetical protein
VLGLCIGGLLLLGVLALSVYIPYLYIRYPGLTDPPARPVDYWPELDVIVSSIAIGIGLLIGLPVFLTSLATWRRLRVQSKVVATSDHSQEGGEPTVATEAAS